MKFSHGLVLAFVCAAPWSLEAAGADWKVEKEKENITVSLREFPGAEGAKAFKSVTTIKAPYQTVVDLIGNPEKMRHVLYLVESSEVKIPTTDNYALYLVVDMPWPVQNRDVVWTIKKTESSESSTEFACGLDNSLAEKNPALIRFAKLEGSFRVERVSEQETRVIWEQFQDLAGSIPNLILNTAAVDVGYESMKNLKRLAIESAAKH